MVLIAGIGDEVVQFLAVVLLLVVGVLAWLSTQTSERPLIRTLVILERQQPRQSTGPPPPAPAPPPVDENKPAEDPPDEPDAAAAAPSADPEPTEETMTDSSLVRTEELSTIRNRRLAFFDETAVSSHNENLKSLLNEGSSSSADPSALPLEEEEETSDDGISRTAPEVGTRTEVSEPDVGSSRPEAPSAPDRTELEEEVEVESAVSPDNIEDKSRSIRIRLKYINDDLKMVEGSLEEQVGDFKKRHFSPELSCRKVVRLIFNGQQLGQDSWTLRHYGLYDNCVVHCLVNQPRTPPPSPNLNARSIAGTAAALNTWALSNILLASLSVLLCLAWFGRYQYAQFYTATTTVALVGLTGIFTVSLIGLYMPDPASR